MDPSASSGELPSSLVDLLSNSLVLHQIAPYVPVASLCALSSTSKVLHDVIRCSPEAFRYLDLSPVKSANVPLDGPLDGGGISWRAERMDESLSEDDFYSGPLRGIVYRLEKQRVLRHVHTLVLVGLSVTAELVKELLTEDRYNVRLLSIREVKHLNERKLQQYITFVKQRQLAGRAALQGHPHQRHLGPKALLESKASTCSGPAIGRTSQDRHGHLHLPPPVVSCLHKELRLAQSGMRSRLVLSTLLWHGLRIDGTSRLAK